VEAKSPDFNELTMPVSLTVARKGLVFTLAGLTAACTQSYGGLSDNPSAVQVRQELPAPDVVQLTELQRSYRIGPRDSIAVEVFGATELSRTGDVELTGSFAMPLIGEVTAAGKTASELSSEIANRLRGRYLRDPQVTVSVREVRSQQLTVDGAVRQPGVYPVVGRMTLQRAIANARGLDEFARLDQVVVFRTVNQQSLAALFNLRNIREGSAPDPEVFGNDVIVVGDNARRRAFQEIIRSIPVLGVFTPLAR
jgi:polysaccharide biosynthesis/export protein